MRRCNHRADSCQQSQGRYEEHVVVDSGQDDRDSDTSDDQLGEVSAQKGEISDNL